MKNTMNTLSKKSKLAVASSCCFFILFLTGVVAADPPDFNGSWKLNSSMSSLGTEYSFAPQTIKIIQDENTLTVEKVINMMGQLSTTNEKYTLDGTECKNPFMMDVQKTSKALWNDEKLSLWIYSTMDIPDMSLGTTEAYYLDDAGHLVILNTLQSSMGDMSETYVFDRQ